MWRLCGIFPGGDSDCAPIGEMLQSEKFSRRKSPAEDSLFRLISEFSMRRLFQCRSVVALAVSGIALLGAPEPTSGQSISPESQSSLLQQPAAPLAAGDFGVLPPIYQASAAIALSSAAPNSGAVAQAAIPETPAVWASSYAVPQFSLATTPNMIGDLPDGGYQIVADRSPGIGVGGILAVASDERRAKISEDSSPIPTDRVFIDFNHFDSAALTLDGHIIDVDRSAFGVEKTFFGGSCSIEVRVPIITGVRANESDPVAVDGNEGTALGNISVTSKYLFAKSDTWASSVGLTVDLPTGPDVSDTLGQFELTSVKNDSVHLEPFIGLLLAPNGRLFSIGYVQFDAAANGSPVTSQYFGGPVYNDGRFRDPTLMHIDISVGYWLYDRRTESLSSLGHGLWISGIAPIAELHYTTSLESFSQHVASLTSEYAGEDILDVTGGLSFQLAPLSNLTVAACVPLRTAPRDRAFDSEAIVQFNQHF
jgi:hypothetical protein